MGNHAESPSAHLEKTDLYFDWAYDTRFKYFFKKQRSIGALIEWKDDDSAQRGRDALMRIKGIDVPMAYSRIGDQREGIKIPLFWTLTVPNLRVGKFLRAVSPFVEAIELAAPATLLKSGGPTNFSNQVSTEEVLAAVLDDGCAFANARFRQGGGTRVIRLWNQNKDAPGDPCPAFGYGSQFSKAELDAIYTNALENQDEAYQQAGLTSLRRAASHGTHVMDLLAGSKTWDIVFVQFPKNCVDDPSGLWLNGFASDGLRYIVECAGTNTKTIVANLSWGPQTGPHDGTSHLEKKIAALIEEQSKPPYNRKLIVTLPAGNSFCSRAHARIDYSKGGQVDWIVPPDGEIPAFLDFHWPPGVSVTKALLRVTSPSGEVLIASSVKQYGADKTWWVKLKTVGSAVRGLVVVHPTGGPGNGGHWGPHGRWKIEITATPIGVHGAVHLYVARADHNMGARRRAKASHLTDAALEAGRYVAPADRYDEVVASAVRRCGTLNGIATEKATYVAAGYVAGSLESAPYSSSGPTCSTTAKPNYACMTDRSAGRPGVRASGVRSGTKAVLVGTSTAAPQLGRILAYDPNPPVKLPIPYRKERVGKGCVDYDPALNPPT